MPLAVPAETDDRDRAHPPPVRRPRGDLRPLAGYRRAARAWSIPAGVWSAAERRDDRGRHRQRSQYPVLLSRALREPSASISRGKCCDTPGSGHRSSASPSPSCRPTPKHSPSRMPAFDTVAISLALCTIPDPGKALLELGRVCRPGGRIVMLEHVRSTARPLAACKGLFRRSMSAPSAAISTGTPSTWRARWVSRSTKPGVDSSVRCGWWWRVHQPAPCYPRLIRSMLEA